EAGHLPQGLERGGANAPLGHQLVETVEVTLLLGRHSRDLVRGGSASAKHRQLPRINPCRAIFAGLIDAKHRLPVGALVAGTPAVRHALRPASIATSAAPPSEIIAFQPAIETPNSDHCTWSQRTSGVLRMSCRLLAPLAVHWVTPSQ